MLARETKGRVFIVVERMAFGKVLMVQDGRPSYSTDSTVKQLTDLTQWIRQPGTAKLPGGYGTVAAVDDEIEECVKTWKQSDADHPARFC